MMDQGTVQHTMKMENAMDVVLSLNQEEKIKFNLTIETVRGLKAYMGIALPNVLSMIVEFATFDVMIILMGIVGVISQASMVIFMNISV
jgi:hypothetical protein